jgi:ABC-type oligopeptide transport system substrate-binding subunit
MKKSKVLIVFLIGLLLVTGLMLAGCGPNGHWCLCGWEDKGLDEDKNSADIICWNIFCEHKWNKKESCNCW